MARAAGHATYAWCALSSDDAGENRALASNAQEPHPARELLSARRSRSSDRCIRRVLQPPALSREHRQSHPGRRLLRARSNRPTGKRKNQTQDHPKPSVASPQTSRVTSTMMRQTLSWFRPPPVSKSLTTDKRRKSAVFDPSKPHMSHLANRRARGRKRGGLNRPTQHFILNG